MNIPPEEAEELVKWAKEKINEMCTKKLWWGTELAENFSRKLHRKLNPNLKSHLEEINEALKR